MTHELDLFSVLHLFDAGKQSMQISQFVQIEDGSACILSRTKVKLPLLMREQLKEKKAILRQSEGAGEGSLLPFFRREISDGNRTTHRNF